MIERKDFNLEFESKVRPDLEKQIEEQLSKRYGLNVGSLFIHPLQTEDGERFNAILKRPRQTRLEILPVAHAGQGEKLYFDITFEVTSMAQGDGWENFESRDTGFKLNSLFWTTANIEKVKTESNAEPGTEQYELVRKNMAINLELDDITQRIKSSLESYFSEFPNIREHTRDVKEYVKLREYAQIIANDAIAKEFGLVIELREFKRLLTHAEETESETFLSESEIKRRILANRPEFVDIRNKSDKERLIKLLELRDHLSVTYNDDDIEVELSQHERSERIKHVEVEIKKLIGDRHEDPYNLEEATKISLAEDLGIENQNLSQSFKHLDYDDDQSN